VREFTFDGDDAILGCRGGGVGFFMRLERRGDLWDVRKFPFTQYPPEDTYDLHRDSRGVDLAGDGIRLVGRAAGTYGTIRLVEDQQGQWAGIEET